MYAEPPNTVARLEPHKFCGLRQWGMQPEPWRRCVHVLADGTHCHIPLASHPGQDGRPEDGQMPEGFLKEFLELLAKYRMIP